jgi:hypothetical protein
MAHQYEEPIHVGSSVVVDSAGIGGIFWTAQDAIDASFNVKRNDILVRQGTYGRFNFLTGVADGMHLHCTGARGAPGGTQHGVEFQGNGTTNAVTFTSNGRISNCGFWGPGGGGGAAHTVELLTGAYGWFDHNVIRDSDSIGLHVNMTDAVVAHNTILDADGDGIYHSSTGDRVALVGNHGVSIGGTNFINANGSTHVSAVGNVGDKPVVNGGTGSASAGNVEF